MPGLDDDNSTTAVSVVIVTHNSADVLTGCLRSLPDALRDVGPWTVTVVDNASSDATLETAAESDLGVKAVPMGRNAGYSTAINAGVDASGPDGHVLILNPDVRLAAGCGTDLVNALARPGVGIAVPPLVEESGELSLSLRNRPTVTTALGEAVLGGNRAARMGRGEVVADRARYQREHAVDWATGALMMVSRDCLSDVGPWDESFFLYSEETDFCLRAHDKGYLTWFTPTTPSVHIGGESNESDYLWSLLTVNRVRAFRNRNGAVASALFWLAALTGEAVRALAGSKRHRAGARSLLRPGLPLPEAPRDTPTNPAWICFSAQDWWYHNRAHSDFQLMRRIARKRPVLFINSIGMRMPMPGRSTQVTRRILRKARSVLRFLNQPLADTPDFHVMTPVILPFYGSPAMRAVNARLVRFQARVAARRVGIDISESVILATIPTSWDVIAPMRRRALVANRSDLHSAFEETDQDLIRQLEQKLLVHSDVVLYTSRSLMATEAPLSGDRSVFLDHGVDLERFGAAIETRPGDIAELGGPVVGFFGGLDDYVVDLELLARVAQETPQATLLLIGDATCPIDDLVALPNVHWLGFRPYEDIPAYGATFDVALMPWLRNDWIQHANPIKLKEYLALGLPVVSTDFPEVRFYDDVVAVGGSEEEFIELIHEALRGNSVSSPDQRRAKVAGATWDRRAEELLALGENQPG